MPYKLYSYNFWDDLIYGSRKVSIEQNSIFDKSAYDLNLSARFFNYGADKSVNQLVQGYYSLCKVGLNIKTRDFNIYKPSFDFQLLDLTLLGNIEYTKHALLTELKLLKIGREIDNVRDNQWIDFKLGYGYTFMNNLDKNIILSSMIGIGFTSYEPDNGIFKLHDEQKFHNFNTSEPNLKIKGELFFNPIGTELIMNNRWFLGAPTLHLMVFKAKLYYSPIKVLHHNGIQWLNDTKQKHFAIYLEIENQTFTQSKLSARLNKISIGINYYFNGTDLL